MNLMQLLRSQKKENSAAIAKERLRIIVAHERIGRQANSFLPAMQEDILQVVRKYIDVQRDDIKINLDAVDDYTILEVNVHLPS